jgi:Flp pilus assembly protein TadB
MTDLITPVILGTFGAAILVVIFGFYILMHRTPQRPQYEKSDFSQRYAAKQDTRYRYRTSAAGQGTYRRDEDLEAAERANRAKQMRARNLMIAVLVVGIIVIAISGILFPDGALGLLFLIFFLPLVLQFIRLRRQGTDRENNPDRNSDEDRR